MLSNFRLLFLTALIMSNLACVTMKPTAEWSDEELTMGVARASGVLNGIEEIPAALQSSVAARANASEKGAMSAEQQKVIMGSLAEAFEPTRLKKVILDKTGTGLSREEKIQILGWYQGPIGQKVLQLEHFSGTPQFQQGMEYWLSQVEKEEVKIDKETLQFAKKALDLSGALEMTVEVTATMTTGMMRGVNFALPKEKRMTELKVSEMEDQVRAKLAESLYPGLLMTYYYTYQGLSSQERRDFLTYLEKPTTLKFTRVITGALAESLKLASVETGQRIVRGIAGK